MKNITLNNLLNHLNNNKENFLEYLRSKYPLFHNSIFFYRDLQFGIKGYFGKKGIILSYSDSEKLARLLEQIFIDDKTFYKITDNSYKINNLKYITTEPGDPFKNIQIGGN
jgi:hypothetical protein